MSESTLGKNALYVKKAKIQELGLKDTPKHSKENQLQTYFMSEVGAEDERKYIIGTQGCIWTEWTRDSLKMEWQILPRMVPCPRFNGRNRHIKISTVS